MHPPDGVTELHPLHARLNVRRCRGCANDTVYDLETDEHWDLEPEDYTDAGSDAPTDGMLW